MRIKNLYKIALFYLVLYFILFSSMKIIYAQQNIKPVYTTNQLKIKFVGFLDDSNDPNKEWRELYQAYPNFSEDTGYFLFYQGFDKYKEFKNIFWQEEGETIWNSLDTLNLKSYQQSDIKLNFSIFEENTKNSGIKGKVIYPKSPDPPDIKVDISSLSIYLNSKLQYRISLDNEEFSAWTTPTWENKKKYGTLCLTSLDDIYTSHQKINLEVRKKASIHCLPSKSKIIEFFPSEIPMFNEHGVIIKKSLDEKTGILLENHSSFTYQIAVINGKSGAMSSLANIDLLERNKHAAGYVNWKTINANQQITLPYTSYKNFINSYIIIGRIAGKKIDVNQYQLPSYIICEESDIPKCNLESGVYSISDDGFEENKIYLEADNPIYYTLDGKDPDETSLLYQGAINIFPKSGDIITLKAISIHTSQETGKKKSKILTVELHFLQSEEKAFMRQRWGYTLCKKEDKKTALRTILYQRFYNGYANYRKEIDISDLNITPVQAKELLFIVKERVRYDNPDLMQIENFSYSYHNNKVEKLILKFKYSKTVTNTMLRKCESTYNTISSLFYPDMNNAQKGKIIHDYLILNNEYGTSKYDQEIYGAMTPDNNKITPVCMGYAAAFQYCCQRAGIQCVLVTGYVEGNHAWVMVDYEETNLENFSINSDRWYEVDVTWDEPTKSENTDCKWDYFNITTNEYFKLNPLKERLRLTSVYTSYPVEYCTGTLYSYSNLIN